jgi:glycine/D-amino acid oxidase-like deaminating enzyme
MLAPGGEYTVLSSMARLAMESLEMYPGFIHELEKDSGFKIDFQKSGAIELAYGQGQWVKLHERFCAQLAFGTAVASIVPSSVRCIAPGVDTTDLHGALLYPQDACVSPTDLLQALRIACCRYGVNILENSPVTAIDAGKHSVTAWTAGKRLNARNVVLAAGAWSSQIPIYQHESTA